MTRLRLKIDVSDTLADEAFRNLKHFDQVESAAFGPQFGFGDAAHPKGSDGVCDHPAGTRHLAGEWIGAEIRLLTPLLAQYAVSHYLRQPRVLDADVMD